MIDYAKVRRHAELVREFIRADCGGDRSAYRLLSDLVCKSEIRMTDEELDAFLAGRYE